jgi:hypothetical protein
MPHPPPERRAPVAAARGERGAAASPWGAYEAGLGALAIAAARATEDDRLAAELMQLPRSARAAAVKREPRYHRPTLAWLLALRAESRLHDAAADGDALETAELAAAVASAAHLDGRGGVQRTAALAYWLLGKALLARADWPLAEQAFSTMYAFMPPRSEPSEEQGLACAGLGQLHEDLGRPEKAEALFTLGGYLFARLGADGAAAACAAQLGFALLDNGDLEQASNTLRMGLLHLDEALAPSLAARMRLGVAQIGAALDDPRDAREQLHYARTLYELAPSPAEEIDRSWREARIALAAGQDAEAEALFDGVRRQLLARGSLAEAARATFDQMLLRIEGGRWEAAAELAAALGEGFGAAGEPWAREMGDFARLAAAGGSETWYGASHDFRRRLRQRWPAGPGRPHLLTPTRALADRLLRHRGEHEDPLGAAAGL